MVGITAFSVCYVLFIYFYGHTFTYQRPDAIYPWLGFDSIRYDAGSETFLNVFVFFLIFAGIILDKMGVRFTAILSGAVMLVGATINWYAVTDAFQGSGLQTWFTNNLNYIPGFDELGISPFYRGMPASAKFAQ